MNEPETGEDYPRDDSNETFSALGAHILSESLGRIEYFVSLNVIKRQEAAKKLAELSRRLGNG